jgi:VWFA-related protein
LGFILSYASRVETVQLPTSDVALLDEQARTIQAAPPPARGISISDGGTVGIDVPTIDNRESHLYDALRTATQRYLAGEVGRKAVVVVGLSDDLGSESSMQDALQALLENDVIAYVLEVHDGRGRCLSPCCLATNAIEKKYNRVKMLAEATGGRKLEVKGINKLEAALDEISDELHHQYSLGYYPENKNWDGKFRNIQISAGEKSYEVFARKGYYANRPTAEVAPTK